MEGSRPLFGVPIGATGFEPATSCSQNTRSAKLSYAPRVGILSDWHTVHATTALVEPSRAVGLSSSGEEGDPGLRWEVQPFQDRHAVRASVSVMETARHRNFEQGFGVGQRMESSVRRSGAESVMDEKRVRGIEGSLQWCEGSNQPFDEHVLPAGALHTARTAENSSDRFCSCHTGESGHPGERHDAAKWQSDGGLWRLLRWDEVSPSGRRPSSMRRRTR